MKKKTKKINKPSKRTKKAKRPKKAKNVRKPGKIVKKTKIDNRAFFDPAKIANDLKSAGFWQTIRTAISSIREIALKKINLGLSGGKMTPHQAKVSLLVSAIMVAGLASMVQIYVNERNRRDDLIVPQKSAEEVKKEILERKIKRVVKGSPIESMVPYIAQKDEKTAAFIIGIAKKESNWGSRKPVLDGQDCFNYWGFRQERERMGSGGHTCFDNPKDAVDTVAKRISQIIEDNDVQSAKNMIVWKCGYSCENHSDESVRSWISDVDYYAEKILK